MKYIIFLIFLIFIDCSPLDYNTSSLNILLLKRKRIDRNEKILECVKSKGSQTLIKLLSENKGNKIGKFLRENKSTITEEDKILYHGCRKKVISGLKVNRRFRNKIKNKKFLKINQI